MFSTVDYNIVLGILTVFFNFSATVCWNLMDLFLGLMGIALSSRLRLINQHLATVHGKVMQSFISLLILGRRGGGGVLGNLAFDVKIKTDFIASQWS